MIAAALMVGAALSCASPSVAEPPPKADAGAARHVPASMSAKEYDAMLDDIAETVVQRLRAAPAQAAPQSAGQGSTGIDAAKQDQGSDAFNGIGQLLNRAGEVLGSLPGLHDNLSEVVRRLGGDSPGGAGRYFLWLLLGAVLAVFAERATRSLIARLARESVPETRQGLPLASRIMGRALLDAAALIPLWLVLYLFPANSLDADWLQPKATQIIFTSVVIWRVAVLAPRIWFRPKNPELRIAALGDADARRLYYMLSAAALVYVLAQAMVGVLVAADAPANVIVIAGFFNNLLFTIVDYTTIFVTLRATGRWLASLVDHDGSVLATIKLRLARYWWVIGILADTVMTAALAYGMLSGNQDVGSAIVTSLTLVVALIFLETLYDYMQRPAGGTADEPDASKPRPTDLVARCLRFVTRLLILTAIVEIWMFDVLPLLSAEDSTLVGKAIKDIFVTISLSYVVWQIACFYIGRLLGGAGPAATGPSAAEQSPGAGSRLHTMLPLARMALGITIAVLAILTILSRLGVNIAPLIAGASVLGLAISFGSQTLVRDIVSGIFYLADDAFRVGEYIDCGKVKGTVEGFTLRSIKLRHQNGQLHTVPFGQLGSITNFSRDWITLKFNLRLVRDVDLELVRKTTKKIGAEMMNDPELAPLIIEPLKLQGVADILDNAMVLRFKVTAKPGNPTLVQRQAVKRMIQKFGEVGINFPTSTVTVQTLGGAGEPQAHAAAASDAVALRSVPSS
ncbi:Small-conductance mechanosensitive channel [Rhizobiales bacterium GAS188]|nr:Small-conductance mechanosensitive channel [Rhizobiales bacterium GAS188]